MTLTGFITTLTTFTELFNRSFGVIRVLYQICRK